MSIQNEAETIITQQYLKMGIQKEVYDFGHSIEAGLKERFEQIDKMAEYNQLKVIHAMQKNKVSAECFNQSSGYGYNDLGRDTLEKVYADVFCAEDALVRPQITCGTHALALALMSNLRPGDELLSPVGKPYDTLEEVIGIRPSKGSLAEYGISYRQVDLLEDGSFNFENIKKAINDKTKLVTIQRSKGYQTRPTLSVDRIGELIAFVKKIKPDVICMVDRRKRTDRGRGRYDRRFSDQKSGRRTCTDRRLHCRKAGVCGKCSLPTDISGTWKRGRSFLRSHPVLLSGLVSGTGGYGRRIKGSYFCGKYL